MSAGPSSTTLRIWRPVYPRPQYVTHGAFMQTPGVSKESKSTRLQSSNTITFLAYLHKFLGHLRTTTLVLAILLRERPAGKLDHRGLQIVAGSFRDRPSDPQLIVFTEIQMLSSQVNILVSWWNYLPFFFFFSLSFALFSKKTKKSECVIVSAILSLDNLRSSLHLFEVFHFPANYLLGPLHVMRLLYTGYL